MRRASAALAVLLAAVPARGETVPSHMVVEEVRFQSAAAIDAVDFRAHCPLRAGDIFSEDRVAESIRWFERKETFRVIEAVVEPRGDRASVTFRLTPVPYVVAVSVQGAKALGSETVLRTARIREDEPLSEGKTDAAEQRLLKLYRSRGYRDVEVSFESTEESAGRVAVTIHVREGSPRRIERLDVRGVESLGLSEPDLGLGVSIGDVASDDLLAKARSALQRLVRGRGFYEAEVEANRDELPGGGVALRYEVSLGPRFELRIEGNRALSSKELLGLIDLSARPIITGGTWRLMAIRMRERYQEAGFRFAEVTVSIASGAPTQVRFSVDEGPAVHVVEVRLVGNHALSSRSLLAAMVTQPRRKPRIARWWARWSRGADDRLRETVLAEDLERIARAYRERGFPTVHVVEASRSYSADRSAVSLVIEIREGDQRVIEAVDVSGADEILPRAQRGLRARPGVALRADDVDGDRETLLRRLAKEGYVDATVTSHLEERAGQGGVIPVRVSFHVDPGRPVRIGQIIVQQNYATRDSVVRNALPFATGDPLDPEALAAGQSDLYRLGIFRSVTVQPEPSTEPIRNVDVRVAERPGGELQYGIGYDTRAGVHNFLQIGHRNIAGTGDQLTLRGDLNLAPNDLVPDEYIASLEGKQPHFLGSRYDLKGSVARRQSERSIDEFSIRETSTSLGFEREFVRGLRATFAVEFQDSDIFGVQPDAVLTGRDVGKLRTVSLNPILLYDGRDDPFAPTRGVFESLRFRYATPRLGSDVDFFKIVAQHSQYVPLVPGFTWIYGVRIGWAKPLGDSDAIPLRDRFFLGGRTSVRGFDENEIGPRGVNGNPIGGDLLFNLQSELRFPLFYGLGGAVFFDGGALYLQDRAISLGEFRESIGPGLRYQTPVGSISLDYGFKIGRRARESIGEVHFTIGNIF